jgi:hypothetical protein
MPVIITTPRPPLNLFEVVRVPITDAWTTVYEVPLYRIPASGPTPQRDVDAAAIMTGVVIANTSIVPITVSARILDVNGDPFGLLERVDISVGDYLLLDIERQVLKTDEILQLQCGVAQTAIAHFSFVLNQREEFEVIV